MIARLRTALAVLCGRPCHTESAAESDCRRRMVYVARELGANSYEPRHLRAVLLNCGCAPSNGRVFRNLGDCPRCRE